MSGTSAALSYTRYELLRTVRNKRFFIFSLVFPLLLYFSIAASHRTVKVEGVTFPLYYMTGMVSWGTMAALMAGGARIALERSAGWTRQMRITPLSTWAYFGAKIASGYMMASVSIVLLYLAGIFLGVHLSAQGWLIMTGLILVGLIPFALLGIVLGHLLSADSIGPALGGGTSVLALLGGSFGPLATSGTLQKVLEYVPSYWLVQAGRSALAGHAWPLRGWIIMAVWTAALARLAVRVYQRDTARS
jgi:ABC-2 type transport system permease protein